MEQAIYQDLQVIFGTHQRPTVVECGAHEGYDTINMLRLFLNPRMVIFEPDPRNLEILRRRGLHAFVTLIPAAVGAANGKTAFYLSSGVPPWDPASHESAWAGSSSIKRPKAHLEQNPWCKFDRTMEVEMVALDSCLAGLGISHLDFLWADIQGAEADLIRGAMNVLAHTRYFYTEYSNAEVYEGQQNLATLLKMLPGKWEIARDFGNDVLFKNVAYAAQLPPLTTHARAQPP